MPLKLTAYGLTETGLVREHNEDAWQALEALDFYVLADGMGGHQAGEVASQQTVSILCEMMEEVLKSPNKGRTAKDIAIMLRLAIVETNRRVYKLAQQDPSLKGMGTTLCCFLVHGYQVIYAHLGDSRIYRMRNGALEQLTKDHSLYSQMKEKGELTEEELKKSSFKNVVTKCVGTGWLVDPAIAMDALHPGDRLMMCSDGLTDMVPDSAIETILAEWPEVDQSTHNLVDAALMRGGYDNITVVMVAAEEERPLNG